MLGVDRLVLVAILMASSGFAQTEQQQKPGRPAPGPPPASEETRLRAEKQEMVEAGHFRASGFVDLQAGETRIQSDVLDRYQSELADGSTSHRIVATGNVVFMHGEERIAGSRLEMDLNTGIGTFNDAVGYIEPGVFVEARTIERLSPTAYRVQGARFTSCAQPNPRWGFTASSARIYVDDKIIAKNVAFKVKSVPAFYLPYLYYPIGKDERSTGILLPHLGYSSVRGFIVGGGFFWAMGRSADQTFTAENYSRYGAGFGHELRYVVDPSSRGTFRSYYFRRNSETGTGRDFDLTWNAMQSLPFRLRASLNVRRFSSISSQQQLQDGLDQMSMRQITSAFNIQGRVGSNQIRASADTTSTYWGEDSRVNQHLPSVKIQRFPQKLGKTPFVFGYEASADYLGLGVEKESAAATDSEEPTVIRTIKRYSRFDFGPELSVTGATPYLQVTPRITARYTRYGNRLIIPEDEEDVSELYVDQPVTRTFFEGNIEVRGPTFSRIFNSPGEFLTDKLKHVIGPEVTFTYRSPIKNWQEIPVFDSYDQFLGTNEIRYSLVQRLYGRRAAGTSGKKAPYQLLQWRLTQTYYVQISDGQNNFDPNYSTAVFGPGGVPSHYSPVQSKVQFKPTRSINANFDVEYDTNYRQLRTMTVGGNLRSGRVTLNGSWNRRSRLNVDVAQRTELANYVRAQGSAQLLPGRLQAEGGVDYDYRRRTVDRARARIRYDVQCCGFGAEMIKFKFNNRVETRYIYFIELANIGSIGNFMADDPNQPGGAGLGAPR